MLCAGIEQGSNRSYRIIAIENLKGLSVSAYNVLKRSGINDTETLCAMSFEELRNVQYMYAYILKHIIKVLDAHGLTLRKVEMELHIGKKPDNLQINWTGKDEQKRLDYIRKFYGGLSDEEFKERMIHAGFEIIEDGKGEMTFEENHCSHCGFEIKSDYIYAILNNWCPACGARLKE